MAQQLNEAKSEMGNVEDDFSDENASQPSKFKKNYFYFRLALWPTTYVALLAAFVFVLNGVTLVTAASLIVAGTLIAAAGLHLLFQQGLGNKVRGTILTVAGLMFLGIGVSLIISMPIVSPVLLGVGAIMMTLLFTLPAAMILMGLVLGAVLAGAATWYVFRNETQPQYNNDLNPNASKEEKNVFKELWEMLTEGGSKSKKNLPKNKKRITTDEFFYPNGKSTSKDLNLRDEKAENPQSQIREIDQPKTDLLPKLPLEQDQAGQKPTKSDEKVKELEASSNIIASNPNTFFGKSNSIGGEQTDLSSQQTSESTADTGKPKTVAKDS